MPTVDDAQLPIRRQKLSGPGVDAWGSRRESGANKPFDFAEVRQNFQKRRDEVFRDLRRIIDDFERLPQ